MAGKPRDPPDLPALPMFFADAAAFGAWLAKHHASQTELLVGFHKVGSPRPSMSWPESVDEALCVGWIDGVRKRLDDHRYTIRFSPRKPGSIWSTVNMKRVAELATAGRMQPAGLAAFARRSESKSGVYAYEQRDDAALGPVFEAEFRADAVAWIHFEAQAPWYRKQAIWRVVSAKREETRRKRLAALIDASRRGVRWE